MRTPTLFRAGPAAPGDRGLRLGRAFPQHLRQVWEFYDRLFTAAGAAPHEVADWGLRALDHIEVLAPELAEEIDGMARGSGLPAHRIAALNARTEILGRFGRRQPECSTVVHAPADGRPPVTLQTWDWHDGMRDGWFVHSIEQPPSELDAPDEPNAPAVRTVHTLTEYGIVGKIGVNSAGLGLHFNILGHRSDEEAEPPGTWLPVHVLARRLLDTCSTVEEAVQAAMSTPVAASSSLTLVGYHGGRATAATVELSPSGTQLLHPAEDGYLLRTNHFTAPALAPGEVIGTEDPDTYARLKALHQRTQHLQRPDRAALLEVLTLHADQGAALCCHAAEDAELGRRWETLATVSLNVQAGALAVQTGGPCTALETNWTVVS